MIGIAEVPRVTVGEALQHIDRNAPLSVLIGPGREEYYIISMLPEEIRRMPFESIAPAQIKSAVAAGLLPGLRVIIKESEK